MIAPTFTPGPWTCRTVANPIEGVVLIESADDCIARVLVIDDSDLANARLIKAAPSLHAALGALLAAAEAAHWPITAEQMAPLENARAALAEAVQS